MTEILGLAPGRSAEDAVRHAARTAGAAGWVVGADLLAGPGPAAISALAAHGQVLALAGLHGDPDRAAAAADRLAGYGASWVTAPAAEGSRLLRAVAAAGVPIVVTTLPHGERDDAAAAVWGRSRGATVARLAKVANGAGAEGILCDLPDLGVVAEVAGSLTTFAWADSVAEAAEAAMRGADYVIVDGGKVAEAQTALDAA